MTTPQNNLYKYDLMDHGKNPKNYGLLPEADFCVKQQNLSCGDMVTMSGIVQGGHVVNLGFEGTGCMLSMAMASKLTEHAKGMSVEAVLALDETLVAQLLGMDLGINRLQCGMLSIVALKQGVVDHLQKR